MGLPKRIPVLAMGGTDDKLTPPRCLKEMRALLAEREQASDLAITMPTVLGLDTASWMRDLPRKSAPWQCVTCKGSGHLVPLEQPQAFRASLTAWAAEVQAMQPDARI